MKINIAGAFAKSKELRMFVTLNKKICDKIELTVYDGIDNCSWNGGRINRDITYSHDMIDFYYRHGIGIALTFTNPVVDVHDAKGNELLEKFHRPGNVIISVNTRLREYIKNKFPDYKHTKSITSFGSINVPMSDADLELYKTLESEYDYIVPRCEHVFDERFQQLNQSKYEILLNDTCIYNCPFYGEHFGKIAEQNRLYKKPWEQGGYQKMYEVEECWISDRSTYKKPVIFDPDVGDSKSMDTHKDNYGMDLKHHQIKRLLDQGVTNFKISGREMSHEDFIGELKRYIFNIIDAHE